MKVNEFAKKCGMSVLVGKEKSDKQLSGVYVCDLLSWVMSKADKGTAWITVHTNINIIAVALLTEVSCIIIPENINVESETIKRAEEEGIVILSSELSAYEICSKAYGYGIGKG